MNRLLRLLAIFALLGVPSALAQNVPQDSVAQFYKGRQVT